MMLTGMCESNASPAKSTQIRENQCREYNVIRQLLASTNSRTKKLIRYQISESFVVDASNKALTSSSNHENSVKSLDEQAWQIPSRNMLAKKIREGREP